MQEEEIKVKEFNKLLLDSELVHAKARVFHFLSNILVCLRKRGFGFAPSKVEDYLNGTPCANLDYTTSRTFIALLHVNAYNYLSPILDLVLIVPEEYRHIEVPPVVLGLLQSER